MQLIVGLKRIGVSLQDEDRVRLFIVRFSRDSIWFRVDVVTAEGS